MKKILVILVGLIFVFGVITGCSGNNKTAQNTESNSNSVTASVISVEDVNYLDANGESVYRIVRPDGDVQAVTCAQLIYKQMKSILGINVRNISDAEDGTDVYEIIVGDCNRPEVELAKTYLLQKNGGRYKDYIICTVGKKIIIYSQCAESLSTATERFIGEYIKTEGVSGGIECVYRAEGEYENLTVNGISLGRFTIVRQHYNASYLTQLEMEKLVEAVFSKTGYKLNIVHDAYTKPAEFEIVVGDAERDGVDTVNDYDEYRITVKDKKIYLNGGSAHATAMAVSQFQKMLSGDITDSMTSVGSYERALLSYDKSVILYKTWGEDFDGDEINTKVWKVGDPVTRWDGLNGKTQVRSSDPNDVFVKDGKFYICGREDENYYYGGIIQTYETYKYGYVEMSSKIPHGTGFWTALYACSDDLNAVIDPEQLIMADPEYDVMECFGNSEHYQANIHSWPRNGGYDYGWEHISLDNTHGNEKRYRSVDSGVPLGYDFHTYGMMWDNEKVTFTCDADPFFTYDTTTNGQDIETNNHNVWLRIAMNVGSAANPEPGITDNPDDWVNTNKFVVDWINVYQKNDGLCEFNKKVLK